MNATEHLLTCLAEEGAEITHRSTKCLRFGMTDRNVLNPTGPTNEEHLVGELNDLMAVIELLIEAGVLPEEWQDMALQQAKKDKVQKFMGYADRVGTLERNHQPSK